jgi:nitroreductase
MEKKISRRQFLKASTAAGAIFTAGNLVAASRNLALARELPPIQIPKPQAGGGTLVQLLEKRASSRQFGPEPLPPTVLANLVWAAAGINRPDGRRTAPTASNRQEIDVYVAAVDGLYFFDPKASLLKPILAEDIRRLTGTQPYVGQAAVNLVFVADMAKMSGLTDEQKTTYAAADTGFISQNVYLYCAAEGLATVVRASIDKVALAKAMKLRPDQVITLAQSVGYPKKGA